MREMWRPIVWAALLALAANQEARAGFTTYTSSAAYDAALAGIPGGSTSVEDYGTGFNAGELIGNGSTFHGLTYQFVTTSTLSQGIITDQFDSFTGLSLGGDQSNGAAQFFFDGDQFSVTFAQPVSAVGIFFNVNLNSGNFGLNTSAGSAVTGSATYDTSTFVFAGGISTTPFTSASFFSDSGGNGTASYNVPEITFTTGAAPAAPAPPSLLLCGIGAVGLAVTRFGRFMALSR
jgi:hypothetical protein